MSDLQTAATQALNAIAEGGLIESYDINKNGRSVTRGSVVDQVDAAIKLQALANRQANGNLFQIGVFTGDR